MLKDLNLPVDIIEILIEMPEEIRAYIIDEIVQEAMIRKDVVEQVNMQQ